MISRTRLHFQIRNIKHFHTFEHIFHSPKQKIFEIKPLTAKNLEENAQELTKSFKFEPVCEKYDYETLLKIFSKIAQKSLREDIGLVCYEQSTGKWAGCLLSEDYSTTYTDPSIDLDGKSDLIIHFMSFLEKEGLKKLGISHSKTKYEQIHVLLGGVGKDFWGNKVLYNLATFFHSSHPIVKNSKLIFAECTNANSRKACEQSGMETVYSIKYSDMAKTEELKDYLKDYKEMLKNTMKSEDEIASFNCLIRY